MRTDSNFVERLPPLAVYAIICIVSLAIYGQAVGFPLIWDSHILVVQNPAVETFDPLAAFTTPTTIDPADATFDKLHYYRPVLQLFFSAWYKIAGENPALWHAMAVAINIAAAFLVFRLMLAMDQPRWAALAVALLYAVNPGRVAGVTWVYGLSNQVYGVFVLAAFLCWVREARWWSLGFFVLALGSRETAILFPVAAFFYEMLFRKDRIAWRWLGAEVALAAGYLVARSLVGASAGLTTLSPVAWLNSVAVIITNHLLSMTAPWWGVRFYLLMDYTGFSLQVLLSYAVLCVGLVALIWSLKRNRWIAFWLLWFGVWLSIHFNVGQFGDFLMDEKNNYLLALSFAVLLVTLAKRAGKHALLVCAAVIVAQGALSAWRVTYWREASSFFGSAVEYAPDYSRIQFNLGLALFHERQDYQGAETAFRKTVELAPKESLAWTWFGQMRYLNKDLPDAMKAWHRALELDPKNTLAAFDLSLGYRKMGDKEAAAKYRTLFQKLEAERSTPTFALPKDGG